MSRILLLSGISALSLVTATYAAAQAVAPSAGSQTMVEEVVVTGSRIARRDFVSASPIVTTSQEALKESGQVAVEMSLNQLPQFMPSQNVRTGGQTGGGRATLNLRGLGENRNLLLLDGRRLPVSASSGAVDVNVVPQSILSGVEAISGGASAVYGSDAISGVVNFKTIQHFNGVQIDSQYGWTANGGGAQTDLSISAGGDFTDGRGSALLSLGYYNREEVMGAQRPFFFLTTLSSFIGQGTYIPGTNQPSQAALNAVFGQYGVPAGAVARNAGIGTNDDSTLFVANGSPITNYKGPTTGKWSTVGGQVRMPVLYDQFVVVPGERKSVFGKIDFELRPGLVAYGQVLGVDSFVNNSNGFTTTSVQGAITIPVTNPFIPQDLRTLLASRPSPTAPFSLDKRFMMVGKRNWDEQFDVYQYVIGLRGELPNTWKWDVYGSTDSTHLVETNNNALLHSRLMNLVNAPDGGASICRGGLNLFGVAQGANISPECQAYLTTKTHGVYELSQNIVEASLQGVLFALPADQVRFSATANYRKNNYEFQPDPLLAAGDVRNLVASGPGRGSMSVKELSGELFVPLLRNLAFAQSLNVNLGYRYSNYNTVGGVSTYKAEVDWKPISTLLVRGGYERAIRAPNIQEVFSALSGSQGGIGAVPTGGDPCDVRTNVRRGANGAQIRTLCGQTGVPTILLDSYQYATVTVPTVTGGNTGLAPETADTFTAGLVWRPAFQAALFSNISASVDYYNIALEDQIGAIPTGTIVNKCYNLDGSNSTYSPTNFYCNFIHRNSFGDIDRVDATFLNLGALRTDGFDFQVDWSFGLGAVGLDDRYGRVSLNSVINYTRSFQIQTLPNSPYQDFAGTVGSQSPPQWRSLTTLNYSKGPLRLGVRWQFIPALEDQSKITQPANVLPGVSDYSLFDLTGSYALTSSLDLRGGITNVADRQPETVGGLAGATTLIYDAIGRSYYLGLRARF